MEKSDLSNNLSGPHHYLKLGESSRRLIVVFSAKNLGPGQFNFWQLANQWKDNVLFLNNGANQWYQSGVPGLGNSVEETLDKILNWATSLDVNDIVCIGTSMGGFAAIWYGALLNARVLSFATDVKIGTAYGRSREDMAANTQVICNDLRPILKGTGDRPTLIVGEGDPRDLYSADLIKRGSKAKVFSLRGVDHYVPTRLTQASQLPTIIDSFVQRNTVGRLTDRGEALLKQGYAVKTFRAYDHNRSGNWSDAIEQADTALKLYPFGEAALFEKGMAALKLDDTDLAIEALSLAHNFSPNSADTTFWLASALRKKGHDEEALYLLQKNVARAPSHARSHYALAILSHKRGKTNRAAHHATLASMLDRSNKTYAKRKAQFAAFK